MKEQPPCVYLGLTGACLRSSGATYKYPTPDIVDQPFSCRAAMDLIKQSSCNGYDEGDAYPILDPQEPKLHK